ncbi:MAG: hypothetical protein AAF512_14220 [Pseudomonadota bacterium]
MDWRGILGVCITLFWLGLLGFYISAQGGWGQFILMPPEEMGNFLGGAFAPLAFLWLVIGFFLQQKEITQNAEGIRIQAQHTRLDTFMKMREHIFGHLGVISGYLYISSQGMTGDDNATPEEINNCWQKASDGDHGVFCRKFIELAQNPRSKYVDRGAELFYGTPIRTQHTENFMRVFEAVLKEAAACTSDNTLKNALENGTAEGLVYQIMLESRSQNDMPQTQASEVQTDGVLG